MPRPNSSSAYHAAKGLLDAGFRGTYGQLGARIGVHPRAAGSLVRKYGREHPRWDPWNVVAARTGRPGISG
jgi:hypothetical protein